MHLESSGLKDIIEKTMPNESDTFLSLIAFKLLDYNANCYAERWYNGSAARYLYPNAE
ncbi:MAG: hypothetical protein LBF68_06255 [Christensenellaceae bacterium]|jgi:hypothetical protein|nr:hypothetical protein [Christensenellaceae bacterium]